MRAAAALACVCVCGLAGGAAAARPPAAAVLVELRSADSASLRELVAGGATRIAAKPPIWKLPASAAGPLLAMLERRHDVRSVAGDRQLEPLGADSTARSLAAGAWWLGAIDARRLEPPGPGKRVTVVDTGLDFSHPEFAGRPNTVALDRQQITSADDFHGTAISSLIGAQGKRITGVYPRARLYEWDASEQDGLNLSAIIAGIQAAARAGPGVINLSFGSDADVPMLKDVILQAIRNGSIVVAASGDSRGFDFSPYPAEYPHVLTVAATDRHDRPATFSSPSSSIDIAAPGVAVTVAVPESHDPSGYVTASGTSYSAALVSGALAWIWTRRPHLDNTQLLTLVRRTSRHVGSAGVNNDTGYGVLDMRAALSAPAPPPDPLEPNDDVALVRPHGLFGAGAPLLTSAAKRTAFLRGRLDQNKDPADVYRARIPAHGKLTLTLGELRGDVSLRVWGPRTPTILERGRIEKRDVLAARRLRRADTLAVANDGAAAEVVYVDVSAGVSRTSSYALRLSTSA